MISASQQQDLKDIILTEMVIYIKNQLRGFKCEIKQQINALKSSKDNKQNQQNQQKQQNPQRSKQKQQIQQQLKTRMNKLQLINAQYQQQLRTTNKKINKLSQQQIQLNDKIKQINHKFVQNKTKLDWQVKNIKQMIEVIAPNVKQALQEIGRQLEKITWNKNKNNNSGNNGGNNVNNNINNNSGNNWNNIDGKLKQHNIPKQTNKKPDNNNNLKKQSQKIPNTQTKNNISVKQQRLQYIQNYKKQLKQQQQQQKQLLKYKQQSMRLSNNPTTTTTSTTTIIDTNSINYNKFCIINKTIKMTVNNNTFYQLLGIERITNKKTNKWTIIKTKNSSILLGIVAQKYLKDQSSWNNDRKQCICYNGFYGQLWESGVEIKDKLVTLKIGDIIIMDVQIPKKQISFTINGNLIAVHRSQQIGYQWVKWVPAIWMKHQDDIIEWE